MLALLLLVDGPYGEKKSLLLLVMCSELSLDGPYGGVKNTLGMFRSRIRRVWGHAAIFA